MNSTAKSAEESVVLQLVQPIAEDAEDRSQRLFGKVVQLNAQVCKGPCVSNEVLNGAFVGEATSAPVKVADGRR